MAELIWDGKYKDGKKGAPVIGLPLAKQNGKSLGSQKRFAIGPGKANKIALPFQTIETVNQSAQERQRTLLFIKL